MISLQEEGRKRLTYGANVFFPSFDFMGNSEEGEGNSLRISPGKEVTETGLGTDNKQSSD